MECSMPLCKFCKHYHEKLVRLRPYTCDAFPEAIPDKLFYEAGDHRHLIKGDKGIVFEKREDLDKDDEEYLSNLIAQMDAA